MEKKIAIFPGSFDPFTKGHDNIVRRSLRFMDEVIVCVGINEQKHYLQSAEKRVEAIQNLYKDEPRIKVEAYNCLTVDYAKSKNAEFIVRGVRSIKDFEYEQAIADINKQLTGIETILLYTDPQLSSVSSSVVRELKSYGKDVSQFLPDGLKID
ncbi:MAG: pantetheine-phosphate adenylyltransferase [Bacteroidaceae bacterium]|nr:pantetheine-phosphate adenylyltransferase [Candidatus Minthousia equi]MCQ2247178.1 pantetheine-phosphate adenylyltransferase [Bacteroidaceae bacterium]